MNELKKLYHSNRPLFIATGIAIIVLIYILWKQKNGSVSAPDATAPAATTTPPTGAYGGGGTYVEESYYSNAPTANTSTTYNPGQAATPVTPVASSTPPGKAPAPVAKAPTANTSGLLGPGVRIFPNYVGKAYYYRGPSTGGKIIPIPLPADTCYQPGASGRYWYQSPCGSAGKLLTSG